MDFGRCHIQLATVEPVFVVLSSFYFILREVWKINSRLLLEYDETKQSGNVSI